MNPSSHQRGLALREFQRRYTPSLPGYHAAELEDAFKAGWDAQTAQVVELGKEIEHLKEQMLKVGEGLLDDVVKSCADQERVRLVERVEELTMRIKLHEDPVFSRRQLQAKHDALEAEVEHWKNETHASRTLGARSVNELQIANRETERLKAVEGLNKTLCEQNERALCAVDALKVESAKRKEDEQALAAELERRDALARVLVVEVERLEALVYVQECTEVELRAAVADSEEEIKRWETQCVTRVGCGRLSD